MTTLAAPPPEGDSSGRRVLREVTARIVEDDRALRSALRPRTPKLAANARPRHEVERLLTRLWSPQQISAHLAREYRDDESMRVSHETIYQALFVQGRGALPGSSGAGALGGRPATR
jgi:IS30 family transposase